MAAQITGHLTFDTTTRREFLSLRKTIWQAAEPESTPPSIFKRILRQQPGSTLSGSQSFVFSLELPEHVDGPEKWRLPGSFSEPRARFAVGYSVSVQVRRPGLSADSWSVSHVSEHYVALSHRMSPGSSSHSSTAPRFGRNHIQRLVG
jgi:hypothetical protein